MTSSRPRQQRSAANNHAPPRRLTELGRREASRARLASVLDGYVVSFSVGRSLGPSQHYSHDLYEYDVLVNGDHVGVVRSTDVRERGPRSFRGAFTVEERWSIGWQMERADGAVAGSTMTTRIDAARVVAATSVAARPARGHAEPSF